MNHPEADTLAHALAERTGESIEEAVVNALRERLARAGKLSKGTAKRSALITIGRECAALPDYDVRSADEILGYDDSGVPP